MVSLEFSCVNLDPVALPVRLNLKEIRLGSHPRGDLRTCPIVVAGSPLSISARGRRGNLGGDLLPFHPSQITLPPSAEEWLVTTGDNNLFS